MIGVTLIRPGKPDIGTFMEAIPRIGDEVVVELEGTQEPNEIYRVHNVRWVFGKSTRDDRALAYGPEVELRRPSA